ncbi:cAMP-mediated signaling protein SOK1 [Aspergillus sp. HF37]|nr:cAMP-mediated signaling protein SOK1 [Aspergillus sp. HF37]
MRDAPATQEEGSEYPLEAYGGGSHSKNSPKNDSSLDHHHDPHREDLGFNRRSAQFPYSHDPSRTSPPPSQINAAIPPPSSGTIYIPSSLGLDARDLKLLLKSKEHPPVTKRTLSELDLPCIMSNINLRMDANFDRDLHFKPDLDGEKGKRKRREATDYWQAMAAEISIYEYNACHGLEDSSGDDRDGTDQRQKFVPRLPAMLESLQDVLNTLVPERDHPSVIQNLDVSLLMQQIRKGVLDMVGLASWLATLLKTHCAPMRDEWADLMVEQISRGSQSQNPLGIVNGLQTLFAILEAMKLDVANHQIRAFRVLLVEDTVPFLREYFQSKIERDNFEVEASRSWYLDLLRDGNADRSADSFWPVSVMLHGLAELLLQFDHPEEFPETFIFDSDRLWQLRASIQNLVNVDISWYIFESYVHTQKRYLSEPAEIYSTFRYRILSLMEENEGWHRASPGWRKNVRCIALEIARLACAACYDNDVVSDEVIGPIEEAVEWHLSNESELFQYFQGAMQEKVFKTTSEFARKYLNMSPLAICESQRSLPASSLPQQQYDLERIAMRLAHMGILHWRVWAPILYLSEGGEVEAAENTLMEHVPPSA